MTDAPNTTVSKSDMGFPITTLDIPKLRQEAWAYACRQYAATYDRSDPQRALWLRRAERPKQEACNVE